MLLATGLLLSATPARAGGIPPGGLVLRGGQSARILARTGTVSMGRSMTKGLSPFPSIETLRSKADGSDPGLIRLEAMRFGRFRYYQAKIRRQSIGDGILTEGGYRVGRKELERQQSRRQQGKKSRSLGGQLLRSIFK